MRVILHFGAHKTGTSLIQKYMHENRLLVRANRIGFTMRRETNRSIGWGEPAFLDERLERLTRDLGHHAKWRYKAFVVSHENAIGRPFAAGMPGLYPSRDAALAKLAERLRDFDTRVVYYIRSQEQFVESYYLQTIHEGGYRRFDDWLATIDTANLSWAPLVRSLENAFGVDRVTIRDFATEIAGGQDSYLKSFFNLVRPGIGAWRFKHFRYGEIKNPSIGDKGLAIALAANAQLDNHKERRAMRKFLQSRFSNTDYARPQLLGAKDKTALRERYAAENAGLVTKS